MSIYCGLKSLTGQLFVSSRNDCPRSLADTLCSSLVWLFELAINEMPCSQAQNDYLWITQIRTHSTSAHCRRQQRRDRINGYSNHAVNPAFIYNIVLTSMS